MPLSSPARRRLLAWTLAGLTVSYVAGAQIVDALNASSYFDGFAMNGAFQLLNPLRRMQLGQLPGRDLFFFHGWGVPYLHYPLFRMLGSNLFASEMARHLVSPALFFTANVAIWRAARVPMWLALTASGVFTMAAVGLLLIGLVQPANSLLGVRSTMPLLTASVAMGLASRPQGAGRFAAVRFELAIGAMLGLTFVFGTEQGLAATAAMMFVLVIFPFAEWRPGRRLVAAGGTATVAVLTLLLVHLLMAGGAALAQLRFAFGDVPGDQFWYFGVPPNPFPRQWSDLVLDPTLVRRLVVALVAIPSLIVGCLRWSPKDRPVVAGFVFLLLYGTVAVSSYLGMFNWHYASPVARIEWLTAFWLTYRFAIGARPLPGIGRVPAAGWVPLMVLLGVWASRVERPWMLTGLSELRARIASGGTRDEALGVTLAPAWSEAAALGDRTFGRAISGDDRLWSTYAGLLEARLGTFAPDTDYVIHALGKAAREQYVLKFDALRPRFATTVRRSYSPYEEWVETTSWPFYERLVADYRPVARSSQYVFWERRSQHETSASEWDHERVLDGGHRFELPAVPEAAGDVAAIQVVELEYPPAQPLAGDPRLREARALSDRGRRRSGGPAGLASALRRAREVRGGDAPRSRDLVPCRRLLLARRCRRRAGQGPVTAAAGARGRSSCAPGSPRPDVPCKELTGGEADAVAGSDLRTKRKRNEPRPNR